MKHKSSVTTFAKSLLCEAARYHGIEIREFERTLDKDTTFRSGINAYLDNQEHKYIAAARKVICGDWEEIIDYIDHYHSAYRFSPVLPQVDYPRLLMPWLASIAVCAIDDIGR